MKIYKKERRFKVGINNIILKEVAKISLNQNEMITFVSGKTEYDIVKKNWGYYATPSINGRLKTFGFKTFIVSNSKKKIYIFLVHKNKINLFKNYIKKERNFIIKELTNFKKF